MPKSKYVKDLDTLLKESTIDEEVDALLAKMKSDEGDNVNKRLNEELSKNEAPKVVEDKTPAEKEVKISEGDYVEDEKKAEEVGEVVVEGEEIPAPEAVKSAEPEEGTVDSKSDEVVEAGGEEVAKDDVKEVVVEDTVAEEALEVEPTEVQAKLDGNEDGVAPVYKTDDEIDDDLLDDDFNDEDFDDINESFKNIFNIFHEELDKNDAVEVVSDKEPTEKEVDAKEADYAEDETDSEDVGEVVVESEYSDFELMQWLDENGYKPDLDNLKLLKEELGKNATVAVVSDASPVEKDVKIAEADYAEDETDAEDVGEVVVECSYSDYDIANWLNENEYAVDRENIQALKEELMANGAVQVVSDANPREIDVDIAESDYAEDEINADDVDEVIVEAADLIDQLISMDEADANDAIMYLSLEEAQLITSISDYFVYGESLLNESEIYSLIEASAYKQSKAKLKKQLKYYNDVAKELARRKMNQDKENDEDYKKAQQAVVNARNKAISAKYTGKYKDETGEHQVAKSARHFIYNHKLKKQIMADAKKKSTDEAKEEIKSFIDRVDNKEKAEPGIKGKLKKIKDKITNHSFNSKLDDETSKRTIAATSDSAARTANKSDATADEKETVLNKMGEKKAKKDNKAAAKKAWKEFKQQSREARDTIGLHKGSDSKKAKAELKKRDNEYNNQRKADAATGKGFNKDEFKKQKQEAKHTAGKSFNTDALKRISDRVSAGTGGMLNYSSTLNASTIADFDDILSWLNEFYEPTLSNVFLLAEGLGFDIDAVINSEACAETGENEEEIEHLKDCDDNCEKCNENYTSFEEAIQLGYDYLSEDSHYAKLVEQVAMSIANDNNDRLFSELVEATGLANRLNSAIMEKYQDFAAQKVNGLLEELSKNETPEVVSDKEPTEKEVDADEDDYFDTCDCADEVGEIVVECVTEDNVRTALEESDFEVCDENVSLIMESIQDGTISDLDGGNALYESITNIVLQEATSQKKIAKLEDKLAKLYQKIEVCDDVAKRAMLQQKTEKLEAVINLVKSGMMNYGKAKRMTNKAQKKGVLDVSALKEASDFELMKWLDENGYEPDLNNLSLLKEELSKNETPTVVADANPVEKDVNIGEDDYVEDEETADEVGEVVVESTSVRRVARTASERNYR